MAALYDFEHVTRGRVFEPLGDAANDAKTFGRHAATDCRNCDVFKRTLAHNPSQVAEQLTCAFTTDKAGAHVLDGGPPMNKKQKAVVCVWMVVTALLGGIATTGVGRFGNTDFQSSCVAWVTSTLVLGGLFSVLKSRPTTPQ